MIPTPSILLFDEENLLRRATALLLGNRGASVTTATSLEEAVALASERLYDIAIFDLTPDHPRPGDILRRLRGEGLLPRRTILCMCDPLADPDPELTRVEVLVKPYAFDRLLESVFGREQRRQRVSSGVFPQLGQQLRGLRRVARARRGPSL